MRAENPWWDGAGIRDDYARMKRRAYFERFERLVAQTDVRARWSSWVRVASERRCCCTT